MTTTPLDEVDDRILLRRHVAGDREAFGEVYRRHRDRMWAVAVGVCGDRELAAALFKESAALHRELFRRFPEMRRRYRDARTELVTKEAWSRVFDA